MMESFRTLFEKSLLAVEDMVEYSVPPSTIIRLAVTLALVLVPATLVGLAQGF